MAGGASDVEVKFGASIEGLIVGVEQAKSALESVVSPISGIEAAFKGVAEVAAAAFAVDKVAEFVNSMGELGEQTERTAKIIGMSTEQVGELNYVFDATGTPIRNLDMMVGRFEENLARAQQGGIQPAAAGLAALGLSAKELIGLSFPEQMDKIADATARFADGTNKLAALQTLGRGFPELIPLLDKGAAGLESLRQVAEDTNSTLSEVQAEGLAEMEHGIVEFGAALKGDGIQAFMPFLSAVRGAVAIMTDLAESFSNNIKQGGGLATALDLAAGAVKVFESAIVLAVQTLRDMNDIGNAATAAVVQYFIGLGRSVGDVFLDLGRGIPAFFSALMNAGAEAVRLVEAEFGNLGTVIGDVMTLNFGAAKAAMQDFGASAAASGAKIAAGFSGVFDFSNAEKEAQTSNQAIVSIFDQLNTNILKNAAKAKEEYQAIWGTGPGAAPESDMINGGAQVKDLNLNAAAQAKQAAEAAGQAFAAEVQQAQDAAKGVETTLDDELKLHQITMSQWLEQTTAALAKEGQEIKAAAAEALASSALTSQQKIAIATKEEHDLETLARQLQQAQTKAAEDAAKAYDNAFKAINSAADAQIEGLLRGTTSWSQALKNVLASLTIDVTKFFVNWGLEAVENQIKQLALGQAQVAAHVTGAAQMTAADQASGAASFATALGNAIKAIGASVGQVVAGVSGFLAPILGPAAPAAGVAAGAAVDTAAMGMLYDTGAWSVPHDMVAGIHAGEVVIPQRGGLADEFRGIVAGGGFGGRGGASFGDVHIHQSPGQNGADMYRELRREAYRRSGRRQSGFERMAARA